MRNLILEEMNKIGADGVEFVPISADYSKPYKMYSDLTLEQIVDSSCFPRSNRRYYKLDGNKKIYFDNIEKSEDDKIDDIIKLSNGCIAYSGINYYIATMTGLERITIEEKDYISSYPTNDRHEKLSEFRSKKHYEKIIEEFKKHNIDITSMNILDAVKELYDSMSEVPNGCNLYSQKDE